LVSNVRATEGSAVRASAERSRLFWSTVRASSDEPWLASLTAPPFETVVLASLEPRIARQDSFFGRGRALAEGERDAPVKKGGLQ